MSHHEYEYEGVKASTSFSRLKSTAPPRPNLPVARSLRSSQSRSIPSTPAAPHDEEDEQQLESPVPSPSIEIRSHQIPIIGVEYEVPSAIRKALQRRYVEHSESVLAEFSHPICTLILTYGCSRTDVGCRYFGHLRPFEFYVDERL